MPIEELLKNPENAVGILGFLGVVIAGLIYVIRLLTNLIARVFPTKTKIDQTQVDNQKALIDLLTQMNQRVITSLEELVRSNSENSETQKRQTVILESINMGIAGFPGQLSANTGIAMTELRDKLSVLNNFANDFQEKMHPVYDYVTTVFAEKDAQIAALQAENKMLRDQQSIAKVATKELIEIVADQPVEGEMKAPEPKADQSSTDPSVEVNRGQLDEGIMK